VLAIAAVDAEHVRVGLAGVVALGLPVLADFFELEADGGGGVCGGGDGDVQVAGEDFGFCEAFFAGDASEGV